VTIVGAPFELHEWPRGAGEGQQDRDGAEQDQRPPIRMQEAIDGHAEEDRHRGQRGSARDGSQHHQLQPAATDSPDERPEILLHHGLPTTDSTTSTPSISISA
jgi:hypothetical protein